MHDIVAFVMRQMGRRAFWLMVVTTFLGILMYDMRATFKDEIFQDAVSGLKGWRP